MTKSEQLTAALSARGFKNAKVVWRGVPSDTDGGYHAYADDDINLPSYEDPRDTGDMIGDTFEDALGWINGIPDLPGVRLAGWPGMLPRPSLE